MVNTSKIAILEAALLSKERESSGTDTVKRFDYQLHWAIKKCIELHKLNQKFVLLYEFHDDIAILPCETNPEHVEYYQIKTTTETYWLFSDILRKQDNKMSIVEKLFYNVDKHKDAVSKVELVSNKPFKFLVSQDEDKKNKKYSHKEHLFNITHIHDDEIEKFYNHLTHTYKFENIDPRQPVVSFNHSSLGLRGFKTSVKGELLEWASGISKEGLVDTNWIYDEIKTAIENSRDTSETQYESLADLIKKRGFCFSDIQEIADLLSTGNKSKESKILEETKALIKQDFPSLQCNRMLRELTDYNTMLLSPSNIPIKQLQAEIIKHLESITSRMDIDTAPELCRIVQAVLTCTSFQTHLSQNYIWAAICYEYIKLQNANSTKKENA